MGQAPEALAAALAGRYRLGRELGQGGMATVFLASDLRHDRQVAIKVMRPEIAMALGRERFLREIHIAAGLTHPHILPLHDSGEAEGVLFYVMPYVDGESLRERLRRVGKLSLHEALTLGREVADALDHAHRKGVIHRDIKPENILMSAGHALVADFGIARAFHASRTEDRTATGISLGTPAYMSPEQVKGGEVDARSDLYSLGCVIYEMLGGQPPFLGPADALMARHLFDPVPSLRSVRPDLPAWVEAAVLRALAKVPADRFASAADLADALSAPHRTVEVASARDERHPPVAGGIESLAVLPLENLSGNPAEEYFADGMTEALITDLAKIRAIRVISRSSVMPYKGARKPLPEIARALNVDAVVEGAVLRSGERVRITAQLVNARTDTHLWAESYERKIADVLDLQSELAQTIAAEIRVQLTPEERRDFQRHRAVDPMALEEYLKGRYQWAKRTDTGFDTALGHFERAIEHDRRYALAHTGLADTNILLAEYGLISPVEALPIARAAALEALEIDDSLAEAHNSLAYAIHLRDWDWAGAEREFRRAIELNPNYAVAHHWYARNLLTQQRWDDAEDQLEEALKLDPLSLVLHSDYGYHGIATRKIGRAIERLRLTLEMDPRFPLAHFYLGMCHLIEREFDKALAEFQQARVMIGQLSIAATAFAYAASGRKTEALTAMTEMEALSRGRYVAPYLLASIQTGFGNHDRAFEYLEQAFAERHNWLTRLPWEPYLDPLRGDPRFEDLVRRVGLPRAPRTAGAT